MGNYINDQSRSMVKEDATSVIQKALQLQIGRVYDPSSNSSL